MNRKIRVKLSFTRLRNERATCSHETSFSSDSAESQVTSRWTAHLDSWHSCLHKFQWNQFITRTNVLRRLVLCQQFQHWKDKSSAVLVNFVCAIFIHQFSRHPFSSVCLLVFSCCWGPTTSTNFIPSPSSFSVDWLLAALCFIYFLPFFYRNSRNSFWWCSLLVCLSVCWHIHKRTT